MVKLVKVNKNDEMLDLEDKLKSHLGQGILHRAFTIFVLNSKNQLLIQKRSKNKFLWPSIWETSCSSHPLSGENYIAAGRRRLKEEWGFYCRLKLLDKFKYKAKYKNIGSENELCAFLIGRYNGKVMPNPKEIVEWRWIDIKELKKDLAKNPKKYAPWLKIALKIYEKIYEKRK